MPTGSGTLAEKLDHLMATVPVGGKLLSSEELAKAVTALGDDYSLSTDYVRRLRRGAMTNPSLRILQGLARVYGIPPSYFTDDDEAAAELREQLPLLAALRDHKIRSLALRTSKLSASGVQALIGIVAALEQEQEATAPDPAGRRDR
jgi:transcriptional regulator with XRE-family HTH domain